MPIYAYACDACGHRQDHLQKMSDAPIAACPQCAAASYAKQLSAPQFQLKGGGWYVTDFRDNGKKDVGKSDGNSDAKSGDTAAGSEGKTESKSDPKSGATSGAGGAASTAGAGASPPPTAPSASTSSNAKAA